VPGIWSGIGAAALGAGPAGLDGDVMIRGRGALQLNAGQAGRQPLGTPFSSTCTTSHPSNAALRCPPYNYEPSLPPPLLPQPLSSPEPAAAVPREASCSAFARRNFRGPHLPRPERRPGTPPHRLLQSPACNMTSFFNRFVPKQVRRRCVFLYR
jgi:hypothetical protein